MSTKSSLVSVSDLVKASTKNEVKNTSAEKSKEVAKKTNTDKTQAYTEKMLEGTVNLVPHIHYKAKEVYDLSGFSKQFDGAYYVKQCNHSIKGGEYSVTLSVIKNELGGKLPYALPWVNPPRKDTAKNEVKVQKTYKAQKGDTLAKIALKFNTNATALSKLNSLGGKRIKEGQIIIISK